MLLYLPSCLPAHIIYAHSRCHGNELRFVFIPSVVYAVKCITECYIAKFSYTIQSIQSMHTLYYLRGCIKWMLAVAMAQLLKRRLKIWRSLALVQLAGGSIPSSFLIYTMCSSTPCLSLIGITMVHRLYLHPWKYIYSIRTIVYV